ncbi:MAG: hypothetical protein MMC23_003370 [Stictis urceolatum]|nr:hypothetical protein [Stictis urceolata]
MSRGGGTTLYVTGFGHGTRARELAYEFERAPKRIKQAVSAKDYHFEDERQSINIFSFAFVEYESRRDADDAYYDMHNRRIGRDEILKIEWARTPPSASWRFDSGRDGKDARDDRGVERGGERGGDRGGRERRRSPRRGRSGSPPRRGRGDYSPRKDDRRDRDYDRRDRDRSRSPDGDREMKDVRRDEDEHENGANGDERKPLDSPLPAHDELDTAE